MADYENNPGIYTTLISRDTSEIFGEGFIDIVERNALGHTRTTTVNAETGEEKVHQLVYGKRNCPTFFLDLETLRRIRMPPLDPNMSRA